MVDSPFTAIPPRSDTNTKATGDSAKGVSSHQSRSSRNDAAAPSGQNRATVGIIKLPKRLFDIRKQAILRGKVLRQESNGKTEIKTDKGKITLALDLAKQGVLKKGQIIEIRLPAGRPPDRAEININHAEKSGEQQATQRSSSTPLEIDIDNNANTGNKNLARGQSGNIRNSQYLQSLKGVEVRTLPLSDPKSGNNAATRDGENASPPKQQYYAAPQSYKSVAAIKNTSPVSAASKALMTYLAGTANLQNELDIEIMQASLTGDVFLLPPANNGANSAASTEKNTINTIISKAAASPNIGANIAIDANDSGARLISLNLGSAQMQANNPFGNFYISPPPPDYLEIFSALAPQAQINQINIDTDIDTSHAPLPPQDSDENIPRLADIEERLPNIRAGNMQATVIAHTSDKKVPVIAFSGVFGSSPAANRYALLTRAGDSSNLQELPVIRLEIGSKLELTPLAPLAGNITNSDIYSRQITQNAAYFLSAEIWNTMQDINSALIQGNNLQAAQSFANIIPSPANPAQIAPAALFFIAAIRAGDIQGWAGDRITEALKKAGKGGLLNRLSDEISHMSQLSSKAASPGEWKAMSLPLFWENQIYKMPIYYKQDEASPRNKGKGGKTTRFIINLDLSHIGKVQIDALFRQGGSNPHPPPAAVNSANNSDAGGYNNKRAGLNIILRTTQPFSNSMRQEIRAIYQKALTESALSGDIDFQSDPDKWVFIHPDGKYEFSQNI